MRMYHLALLRPIPHLGLTTTSSACQIKIFQIVTVGASKDDFIPVFVKLVDDRLKLVM
jgi:hypothetical protein